ncbi:MAG: N-6 DNA methylase [Betaproteobacteria bacterium]|nr:N-6 DNA methylase [Betaproteobacteria bacterium]
MLDTETRRRIDTARDILVGKVPDPKSQVEQITIALIYKFMDDMDAESEELGGKRKFFSGDFARYGWAKLMRSGLGGFEALNLYAEGVNRMTENSNLPPLFRDIFKNAYLPYRDPETLRSFLKTIDGFTYDHSERLGDAFEYLLSVLGAQGDAGQFRTPRHIIDFIVEILQPRKDESILDPACGTAGFLISAYKHIQRANTDKKGNTTLSPADRGRLAQNIKGYDISPDMVRLSLVNLYLHGFPTPHIFEYDTLTQEERWNEFADVILANPPFMSPKGGIRPHRRFSIQAKRSEVLFVDYMAEHLSPKGRAGIIVPEGIIFQSQTAYKDLRKMLVENHLVAVISLPAGCFNPYSGVKTSILIFDKSLAKQAKNIAFFKVENDGYNLGAQRRPIDKNDLPQVLEEVKIWLDVLRAGGAANEMPLVTGLVVPKEKIAANGEFNLSGERYKEGGNRAHKFPLLKIEDVCSTSSGGTPKSGHAPYYEGGTIPWLRSGEISQGEVFHSEMFITEAGLKNSSAKIFQPNTVLVAMYGATAGEVGILRIRAATNQAVCGITPNESLCSDFLYLLLKSNKQMLVRLAGGGAQPNISQKIIRELQIPLPPLEVQKEIVAEIEGYQKVIDGARAVDDNYRPHISVDPDWPIVELKEVIDELESGVSVNSESRVSIIGEIGILKTSCVTTGIFQPDEHKAVIPDEVSRVKCSVKRNSIIISRMNTETLVGANAYVSADYPNLFLPDRLWQTVISRTDVEVRYLQTILASDEYRQRISGLCGGTSGSMKNISKTQLLSLKIPLPPLSTQHAIVAEIEAEQALVAANRELIARMERKIQSSLARVWGE